MKNSLLVAEPLIKKLFPLLKASSDILNPPIVPVCAFMLPDRSTLDAIILPFCKWKLEPDISTVSPLATKLVTSNSMAEPDIFPPVNKT